MKKPVRIKIQSCDNKLLWYAMHIGTIFEVVKEEEKAYWVRELEFPFCLNWVYKKDAKLQ